MRAISNRELTLFASALGERLGIAFDLDRNGRTLQTALRDRLRETRAFSVDEYLVQLTETEVRALAEVLTVGETYFYRYSEQFAAFADQLPFLAARTGRPLRILSAACSSGEEAGTLAIVVRETLAGGAAREVEIHGVDVNPSAIRRARRAKYSEWSLRETPSRVRDRWFRRRGTELELDMTVRLLVSFAERNLCNPRDELWDAKPFDVIFCRNALMYFSAEAAQSVILRLVDLLALGGLLFLGPTEVQLGHVPGLAVRQAHGAFFHERVDSGAPQRTRSTASLRSPPPSVCPPRVAVSLDWAERILGASDRIASLSLNRPQEARPPAVPRANRPSESTPLALAEAEAHVAALALARSGRRTEAFGALLGKDATPNALLVRAVLLVEAGDTSEAERVCQSLLMLDRVGSPLCDRLHAGARYLLALCCDHTGDWSGAVANDHAAVYLEPRFAMPHLHLALMSRRRGQKADAIRELRAATALFAEDDAARVALFGGGLQCDALMALCRAQLRLYGATL